MKNDTSIRNLLWRALAYIVSRPRVSDWLIQRAMKTPYTHLPGYMNRYWLFNAYEKKCGIEVSPISWLPSIRIHHILRRDEGRHAHDHPWDARTVILRGHYLESKVVGSEHHPLGEGRHIYARLPGDTTPIRFGEFHHIEEVSVGGVWTMFITFKYRGTWGFLVNGKKVPWREYMEQHSEKPKESGVLSKVEGGVP